MKKSSLGCAGSAQNCDSLADGEQRFGSSSDNPKDCETDSVSELFVVVPRKRPGVSSVDMLDTMASDAELNVEQTTGTPVLDKLAKIATNRFTIPMPAGWSGGSTFSKYYKKALVANTGQCLLDSYFKTT